MESVRCPEDLKPPPAVFCFQVTFDPRPLARVVESLFFVIVPVQIKFRSSSSRNNLSLGLPATAVWRGSGVLSEPRRRR